MARGFLALAAALALAAPVSATAAKDPRVPALQARVATLENELAQTQAQVTKGAQLSVCLYALDQDEFGGQFHIIGLIIQAVTGNAPGPDPPRFDDKGACAALGITRSPTYPFSLTTWGAMMRAESWSTRLSSLP